MKLDTKKSNAATQAARREGIWLYGLLGLLLLGFVWVLLSSPQAPENPEAMPIEGLYCSAEQVQNDTFVVGQHRFWGGATQSSEAARTGQHASKVAPGEGAQRGFGYSLYGLAPGQVYQATVWRLANAWKSGELVVQAVGGNGFSYRTKQVRERSAGDWERLQVQFWVPYANLPARVDIFVETDGQHTVFFDDLHIVQTTQWPEQVYKPLVLDLQLGDKAWQKLSDKREEAMRAGILQTQEEDWVKGKLRDSTGREMPLELRLKGDWLDHLLGYKWSYRFRLKDPYTWQRLTTFSIHTPEARYYLHEWLLHQLWEREDVLTTRYDLVALYINGESRGLYAYEEHFEKQLVERRERREGPIVKFDETGFWASVRRQLDHHGYLRTGAQHSAISPEDAEIGTFRESKAQKNPTQAAALREARKLMQQYQSGQLRAAAVFDIERLAKFYAISDALNGRHGIVWHNQRFYYNPITNLLEPVGFDGFGNQPQRRFTFMGEGALDPASGMDDVLMASLMQDADFVKAYTTYLYRFTSPDYLWAAFDALQAGWEARLALLQSEYPDYKPDLAAIVREAEYIRSLILPFDNQSLKTYTQAQDGSGKRLFVANSHTLPLEIIGYGPSATRMVQSLDKPVLLPGRTPREFLRRLQRDTLLRDFNQVRYLEEAALQRQTAQLYETLRVGAGAQYLFFRLPGIDSVFHSRIGNWPLPEGLSARQQLMAGGTLLPSDCYEVVGKEVRFKAGACRSTQHILIPAGYEVILPAGLELELADGALFLSHSSVQGRGTAEQPIKIWSADGKAAGFTVMQAAQKSVLRHVVFAGLNTLHYQDWQLTGAVTFYESEVHLARCVIRDNHCEDGLNVVRSKFLVEGCLFTHIFSDGFDSDFSKGEMRNSRFYKTGNDGLDISGTVINVYDCTFEDCGDKGISVGEESDASVFRSSIKGCPIGVASKDLSVAYLRDITLIDCTQGFAAYRKKPDYGGGQIIVEGYTAQNVKRLHAISPDSRLQLGDKLVK